MPARTSDEKGACLSVRPSVSPSDKNYLPLTYTSVLITVQCTTQNVNLWNITTVTTQPHKVKSIKKANLYSALL